MSKHLCRLQSTSLRRGSAAGWGTNCSTSSEWWRTTTRTTEGSALFQLSARWAALQKPLTHCYIELHSLILQRLQHAEAKVTAHTHTRTHTSRLTLHSVQSTESLPGKIMIKSCVYFHFLITNRHSSAYWSKMKAVLTVVASPDRTGEKAVVWNRFSVSWGNTKLRTQAEVELLTGIVWQQICSSVNLWCSLCCRRASLELFSHKCQYLQPP